MVKNINEIIEKDIRKLVDSTIRARGKEYYEEGRIHSIEIDGNKINAEVEGNSIYDVEISIENNEIQCICSCPYDGNVCKHVVAVLYQWINRNNTKSSEDKVQVTKAPAFLNYLQNLPKEELASLLLELSKVV